MGLSQLINAGRNLNREETPLGISKLLSDLHSSLHLLLFLCISIQKDLHDFFFHSSQNALFKYRGTEVLNTMILEETAWISNGAFDIV